MRRFDIENVMPAAQWIVDNFREGEVMTVNGHRVSREDGTLRIDKRWVFTAREVAESLASQEECQPNEWRSLWKPSDDEPIVRIA